MRMQSRGCGKGSDGAQNGGGMASTSMSDGGEGVGGGCDLAELTGVGSGGWAGGKGGTTSAGGGLQGDMCMCSRSCSKGGDRAGNEGGVVDAGSGCEGVGNSCSLAALTGLGSGGCAGGNGGETRVGGLQGVTCMHLRSCNKGSDGAGNGGCYNQTACTIRCDLCLTHDPSHILMT